MAHRSTLATEYASYRPLGTRVLLRRIQEPNEAGGILLPDIRTRVALAEAEVVQVGPAVEGFSPGDHVLLQRQLSFNKILLNGEEFEIVPQDHLVALVERS